MNLCGRCREDFSSLETFDAHRVGVHEYTYLEGLDFDSPREDGRRCLDPSEMRAKGWAQNEKGRWLNPTRSERARRAFEKASPGLGGCAGEPPSRQDEEQAA
jgi:hypothetical protein